MGVLQEYRDAEELCAWYLQESGGHTKTFYHEQSTYVALGQAFFNALHPNDKSLIRGTPHDPFHSNDPREVTAAIVWLVDHIK